MSNCHLNAQDNSNELCIVPLENLEREKILVKIVKLVKGSNVKL